MIVFWTECKVKVIPVSWWAILVCILKSSVYFASIVPAMSLWGSRTNEGLNEFETIKLFLYKEGFFVSSAQKKEDTTNCSFKILYRSRILQSVHAKWEKSEREVSVVRSNPTAQDRRGESANC